MKEFRKVFSQTSWQILGKAVSSLSTVVIIGLITRSYGETGTGIFTLALTFMAFFGLAVDFGLNAYILPHLLDATAGTYWRKLFGLRIILMVVLFVVGLGVAFFGPFTNPIFRQLILLGLGVSIFESAVFVTCNAIFQSKHKYNYATIAWVSGSLLILCLVYIFHTLNLNLFFAMGAYVSGWVLMPIVSLYFVNKIVSPITPIFSRDFILEALKKTWPISLTLILNVVYFRVDSFIMSVQKSFLDVGIYNLAYAIFQAALVIPTFIMNSFYPILLHSLKSDVKLFRKQILIALGGLLLVSITGTILTLFLAPMIIKIITHQGFAGSIDSLRILALSFPAFFVSALFMWVLISLNKFKTVLVIYLVGLIFNFLANIIFIPIYSYIAASWITDLSEYLILFLQMIIVFIEIRSLKSK